MFEGLCEKKKKFKVEEQTSDSYTAPEFGNECECECDDHDCFDDEDCEECDCHDDEW